MGLENIIGQCTWVIVDNKWADQYKMALEEMPKSELCC